MIDFPATPYDQQLFQAGNGIMYQWQAATGVWTSAVFTPNILSLANVATVAELEAQVNHPLTVDANGYATPGDGGGGTFYWDPTSTETPDRGLIFQTIDLPAQGRYKRRIVGEKASCKFWGVGLGTDSAPNDDTVQFVVALTNSPYAIDISKSYVGLNGDLALSMPSSALSPGISSDGTGIFKNVGLLANRNGIVIAKFPFYIDRIQSRYPVSTTTSEPIGGRPFYFRNDLEAATGWRVTNCYFEGGRTAVTIAGTGTDVYYCDNMHYRVWHDVTQATQVQRAHISRNVYYDCGYASVGDVLGGILRVSVSTQTNDLAHVSINDNIFVDNVPNSLQEAIDMSGAGAFDIQLQRNLIYNQANGIEFKTHAQVPPSPPVPFTPDLYQSFNISQNLITLRATVAGAAINMHQSTPVPPAGKSADHKISNNLITIVNGATPSAGTYGVYVEGYDNCDVSDNTIFGVSIGIYVSGAAGFASTSTGHTVRNNRVRSAASSINAASNLVALKIKGNQLRATTNAAINLSNVASITQLLIEQNSIIADASNGINIAFAQDHCRIRNNDITSGSFAGITTTASAGANITDLWIEGNHITPATDGISVGANGTGITITNNTVNASTIRRVWTTTGATVQAGFNPRGTSAAIPTGAGSLGDIYYNHVLGVAGVQAWAWVCSIAGNTGVATWRALNTA